MTISSVYYACKDEIENLVKGIENTRIILKERNMNNYTLDRLMKTVSSINLKEWHNNEYDMEGTDELVALDEMVTGIADRLIEIGIFNRNYKADNFEYVEDYGEVVCNFDRLLRDFNNKTSALGEINACPKCGSPMVVKYGSRGLFLGCTSFPRCNGSSNAVGTENHIPATNVAIPEDMIPQKDDGVLTTQHLYCHSCGKETYSAVNGTCPYCSSKSTILFNDSNSEKLTELCKSNSKNAHLYDPVYMNQDGKVINKNKEKKEEGSIMNMEKIFGGKVGKATEDRFRLSLNGVAIKNNQGDYVVFDGEEVTNVSDFVVDASDIFFKIPVQSVEPGDLIIYHNEPVYVVEGGEAERTIKVLNALSDKVEEIMPARSIFGFQFFIKVVSLFNMGGGAPDMGSNMMLPLMLMGGDKSGKSGMSEMLPLMMMMGQQNGGAMDMNSMLPLMLMGDKSGSGSMKDMLLPMMMMQGGLGQAEGGLNPLMFMMLGEGGGKDSMAELMIMSSLFQKKDGTKSASLFEALTPTKKKAGRKPGAKKPAESEK